MPNDERIIIQSRPHPVFVVERSWRTALGAVLVWMILIWLSGRVQGYGLSGAAWIVLAVGVVRVVVAVLDLLSREHLLTDKRVVAQHGILRTVRHEIELAKVQHSIVVRSVFERLFGLGTIGLSSSGTGDIEVVWRGVEHPRKVHDTIRSAASLPPEPSAEGPIPIIGIVGGIGSGKSTVARTFESLGCVVSDSDREGAEALRSAPVVAELRKKWGDEVIGDDGEPDRGAIAQRVFGDPDARAWLESLVHPIIHETRRSLIQRARSEGRARAIIVDAPLLFEAGVDRECDAVVFVEAPKSVRLARVQGSRGWDEAELEKREKAQLGLETKRERSDHVIVNGGPPDDLPDQVERVLQAVTKRVTQARIE